ncbi:type II toxin-antitoxin system RelE/ParE family toxin [Candidatus Synechococcus spongiarum]|uniref:type II toxin-antitoxin system RelE/ParE family toxin n=1 Tax=Candidatus Synechococcus spongiarum TaxID=431041 RepID=UPI0034D4A707
MAKPYHTGVLPHRIWPLLPSQSSGRVEKEEWKNLTKSVQERFLKKLAERLQQPHIETSRLRRALNRYKIKIGTPAFRLVYEVEGG